jgi:hypothetical protein
VWLVLLRPVGTCLEFRPLHRAFVATYGEFYKRGRPLRGLQDQVGVVVFHLVDILNRILPSSASRLRTNCFGGALVQCYDFSILSKLHDCLRHLSCHLIMPV